MTTATLTPEQLTGRLLALEHAVGQIAPKVERLNRAVIEGDSAMGMPSFIQRMAEMERRIESQIAALSVKVDTVNTALSVKVDTVITERQDEKSQVKGVSRALRIAGFTSVTSVVLFVIAVAAFVMRK